jgi:hypothetical protein
MPTFDSSQRQLRRRPALDVVKLKQLRHIRMDAALADCS